MTQLAEVNGAAVSTVSQRLRVLRERNLVNARRQGKHIYYSLADAHVSNCGRAMVPHGDHVGYLVDGHLHRAHGDHCDYHGRVTV